MSADGADVSFEELFEQMRDRAWRRAAERWEKLKRGRTHCKNGHPWIETNLRLRGNGHIDWFACRICEREGQQRFRDKKTR